MRAVIQLWRNGQKQLGLFAYIGKGIQKYKKTDQVEFTHILMKRLFFHKIQKNRYRIIQSTLC